MMRTFVTLTLLLPAILSHGQSGNLTTAEIQTNIWCDHCIECESCGPRIYFNLKALKGVKKVEVDSEKNLISVRYDAEKLSQEEIEEAISLSGFDANDRKADPMAYEKLDACCKKP